MLAPKGAAALYFLEKLVIDGLIVVGLISGHSAAELNLFSAAVFARALGIDIGLAVGGGGQGVRLRPLPHLPRGFSR